MSGEVKHHLTYPRNIEWRDDIQSFFPPLQTAILASRLRSELEDYTRDLARGWVVSIETMHREHLTPVPTGPQSFRYAPKVGHENFKDEFSLCDRIDIFLRSACGKWLPDAFTYYVLSPHCTSRDPFRFHRSDHDKIVTSLLSKLSERKDAADRFLKETNELFPIGAGDSSAFALQQIRNTIAEIIRRDLADAGGADDHWFSYLARSVSLYLESNACDIAIDELEALADLHFRDWVEPGEIDVQRFAEVVSKRLTPNPGWST